MSHAPAPWSSWSRPDARMHAPPFGPAWQQPHAHRPHAPAAPYVAPAHRVQPAPLPRRSSTAAPALYVLGSFALMLVLAALTSVFGSFAALALIDEAAADDATTEVAPPAASLSTR